MHAPDCGCPGSGCTASGCPAAPRAEGWWQPRPAHPERSAGGRAGAGQPSGPALGCWLACWAGSECHEHCPPLPPARPPCPTRLLEQVLAGQAAVEVVHSIVVVVIGAQDGAGAGLQVVARGHRGALAIKPRAHVPQKFLVARLPDLRSAAGGRPARGAPCVDARARGAGASLAHQASKGVGHVWSAPSCCCMWNPMPPTHPHHPPAPPSYRVHCPCRRPCTCKAVSAASRLCTAAGGQAAGESAPGGPARLASF